MEVDTVDRRKLLGLRDNVDAALNRLVKDYQEMKGLNRELGIKAKLANAELELAKSKLKSVHENLKDYHIREANLLNALFKGLKSPLSAIEKHINQLAQNNSNGESKFSLNHVRVEVHKLWQIIDDLATVEAVQLGMVQLKLEKVNLEEVVNRVAGEHQDIIQHKGVFLNKVVAKGLPSVIGNREQLKAALSHLVDNAICYTPTGGVVTILANGDQPGDYVRLSVVDMRKDALGKMVVRILKGAFPGSRTIEDDIVDVDLGLMVARQIISMHKGEITVESKAGRGTVFTLSLPTAEMGAVKVSPEPA
jgi:signal transduction histidine kinase